MACDALTRIGTPAIPKVISASKKCKASQKTELISVLGEIGDLISIPYLITALKDADSDIQWDAA
jgi:HEAT repeat protein